MDRLRQVEEKRSITGRHSLRIPRKPCKWNHTIYIYSYLLMPLNRLLFNIFRIYYESFYSKFKMLLWCHLKIWKLFMRRKLINFWTLDHYYFFLYLDKYAISCDKNKTIFKFTRDFVGKGKISLFKNRGSLKIRKISDVWYLDHMWFFL